MTSIGMVRQRSRAWYLPAIYGALLIVAGLLASFFPFASTLALGLYLGWALILSGALGIVAAFGTGRHRDQRVEALLGLLSAAAGIVVFMHPITGAFAMLWTVGLWLALSGVVKIVAGVRSSHDRTAMIGIGILDLLLFALLWMGSAWADMLIVSVLIAISLIASGSMWIGTALRLRGIRRA